MLNVNYKFASPCNVWFKFIGLQIGSVWSRLLRRFIEVLCIKNMLAKSWSKHVFDININNRTVNFHPSVSKCWQGWVSKFVKTLQTQLENQYFPGLFICWLKINGLPCSCSEFWGTKTYLSAMLRLFVSLFFCKTNKSISDSAMAASSNMWICQF